MPAFADMEENADAAQITDGNSEEEDLTGDKTEDKGTEGLEYEYVPEIDGYRVKKGKVRDRVSDIIVWHGQDRDLGYGTRFAFYDTCTFVQGCKLTVQITRITFTGRNLTFGGGNLSHDLIENRRPVPNKQIIPVELYQGQTTYPVDTAI